MFEELNHLIREDTVRRVYQAKIQVTPRAGADGQARGGPPGRRRAPAAEEAQARPEGGAERSPAPAAAARNIRTATAGGTRIGTGINPDKRPERSARQGERSGRGRWTRNKPARREPESMLELEQYGKEIAAIRKEHSGGRRGAARGSHAGADRRADGGNEPAGILERYRAQHPRESEAGASENRLEHYRGRSRRTTWKR